MTKSFYDLVPSAPEGRYDGIDRPYSVEEVERLREAHFRLNIHWLQEDLIDYGIYFIQKIKSHLWCTLR